MHVDHSVCQGLSVLLHSFLYSTVSTVYVCMYVFYIVFSMSLNKCFHVSAFVNTLTSCMPPCERVGFGHKRAGFGHKTRYKQASKAVIEA